jgi:4-carboxymuconolactone decarboxylase
MHQARSLGVGFNRLDSVARAMGLGGHVDDYRAGLRSLASSDQSSVLSELGISLDGTASELDPKTLALIRLGALIAVDGSDSCYRWSVDAALAAGATVDEIVGTLMAVAATVGFARSVSAAPQVASALGYDIDQALEAFDDDDASV